MPLSISLLGLGMGRPTMGAKVHMCGIMLVLRAVLNMLERNASPRVSMCLIFSVSGPCEFLFLFCVIASWT